MKRTHEGGKMIHPQRPVLLLSAKFVWSAGGPCAFAKRAASLLAEGEGRSLLGSTRGACDEHQRTIQAAAPRNTSIDYYIHSNYFFT